MDHLSLNLLFWPYIYYSDSVLLHIVPPPLHWTLFCFCQSSFSSERHPAQVLTPTDSRSAQAHLQYILCMHAARGRCETQRRLPPSGQIWAVHPELHLFYPVSHNKLKCFKRWIKSINLTCRHSCFTKVDKGKYTNKYKTSVIIIHTSYSVKEK